MDAFRGLLRVPEIRYADNPLSFQYGQARERIAELVKELVPEGVETKILAKHGSIYKEILDAAEEINADLIFMAAYRPSVKDYLLGSNAARVVRHAQCSVTVVREKE